MKIYNMLSNEKGTTRTKYARSKGDVAQCEILHWKIVRRECATLKFPTLSITFQVWTSYLSSEDWLTFSMEMVQIK